MGPFTYGCVICGHDFDDDHQLEGDWWLDYRISMGHFCVHVLSVYTDFI